MSQPVVPTNSQNIVAQDIVEDVMRRWPTAIRVFLDHHMACPGCAMAGFETLADAGKTYGLDQECFLGELREAAFPDE